MTLDKHKLDGITQITAKTLPSTEFELLLLTAGYGKIGTAPAQGNRLKVWWTHPTFRRIEAIYSADGIVAITAYHV
ncbi:MAG: hypothetical protein EAZ78_16010 [Oscillatoriales cyanobacterium]|jgi:hypothetical protein|uniref:hypothetical protein n=1 Tax=unclassified Microcoleus TaxID=2642155 RepID=UPI001D1B2180|nr:MULTISPECIES: hypothetical protein [unclassified Microcoleus]TAF02050.1 MAG: hypothetical protein EAZ78_16010 [Oscillatoriales cyanobacterium]MCC3568576.1 hypothetical protein [Microcoleus sp. PH2017_31_RDM_U_A]MCC3580852.1 hypothetical protein [Microcoleus sp. PH2017_32_RDM_D_A]MCC3618961.1 hypothetical protein [Microcoleus sp. PH2017_38_RDM_U_B]TAG90090.1 MAG: hypothetical protein EAZ18_19615 [Oscillatoriales cyanobacterium]